MPSAKCASPGRPDRRSGRGGGEDRGREQDADDRASDRATPAPVADGGLVLVDVDLAPVVLGDDDRVVRPDRLQRVQLLHQLVLAPGRRLVAIGADVEEDGLLLCHVVLLRTSTGYASSDIPDPPPLGRDTSGPVTSTSRTRPPVNQPARMRCHCQRRGEDHQLRRWGWACRRPRRSGHDVSTGARASGGPPARAVERPVFHSARMSRGLDRRCRLGSRTDARTPGGVDREDRVSITADRMWWRLP